MDISRRDSIESQRSEYSVPVPVRSPHRLPSGRLTLGGLISGESYQLGTSPASATFRTSDHGGHGDDASFSPFRPRWDSWDLPEPLSSSAPAAQIFTWNEKRVSQSSDASFGNVPATVESDVATPVSEKGVDVPLLPHQGSSPQEEPSKNIDSQETFVVRLSKALVYGTINAVVTLPVMMSFAAIVYKDAIFSPYIGIMVKHIFLASAIHQLVMTFKSTLPFSIGQVQDVGLIFLSSMSSSIAAHGRKTDMSPEDVIGATLTTLAISTIVVGALVVATGYLKLARFVQCVPLPVVGGYLGYVGFFVMLAGVSLSTGVDDSNGSVSDYLKMLSPSGGINSPLTKLGLSVACSILIRIVLNRVKHPAALPTILLSIPAVFYMVIYGMGLNISKAQDLGWAQKPVEGMELKYFWDIWALFNFQDFPHFAMEVILQIPTMLGLFLIVAFGSSMDIAAIQQDYGEELDYNKELITIGLGNLISGCVGAGYTGSYIFSQTIFCMRAGITMRIVGVVVAVVELLCFLLPISPVQYIPTFYFGALMMWLGYDIMRDWLIASYPKVNRFEYILIWITFVAMIGLGLTKGLLIGIMLAALLFSYSYARVSVTAFTLLPSRGCTVRTFEERTVLELFSGNMLAASLSGYIFFGSSVEISNKVKGLATQLANSRPRMVLLSQHPPNTVPWGQDPSLMHKVTDAVQSAPRFLILDFRRVHGVDATAARSFSMLCNILHQLGVELILTHIPLADSSSGLRQILTAHNVIQDETSAVDNGSSEELQIVMVKAFDSMESGISYCEAIFLQYAVKYGFCHPPKSWMKLPDILRSHLELPKSLMPICTNFSDVSDMMMKFLVVVELQKDSPIFERKLLANELYIVEKGKVKCEIDLLRLNECHGPILDEAPAPVIPTETAPRVMEYGPGGIVGELDFFLQRPRSFNAVCTEDCRLLCLTRPQFERMATSAPHLASLLQAMILRSTCLSASNALEAMERAGLEK